jgi:hypothetical protein
VIDFLVHIFFAIPARLIAVAGPQLPVPPLEIGTLQDCVKLVTVVLVTGPVLYVSEDGIEVTS